MSGTHAAAALLEEMGMAREDVMRLVAVRAAAQKTQSWRQIPLYGAEDRDTDLHRQVQAAGPRSRGGRGDGRHFELAEGFRAGGAYVRSVEDLDFPLRPLLRWAVDNGSVPVSDADLPGFLLSAYGGDASSLAGRADFRSTWGRLADTLLADSLGEGLRTPARDEIVASLKLMWLIESTGHDEQAAPADMTVGTWLQRTVVVLPRAARQPGFSPARPGGGGQQPGGGQPAAPDDSRLKQMVAARAELLRVTSREESFEQPAEEQPSELERRLDQVEQRCADSSEPRLMRRPSRERAERLVRPTLTRAAVDALPAATREVLTSMRLDMARLNPFQAVAELDSMIASEAAAVVRAEKPPMVLRIGGGTVDLKALQASLAGSVAGWTQLLDKTEGCSFEAGIGDLLVVRQTLKAYELADFAHVENVLAGESREREHRRLSLREEMVTTETETETEKERDLQSTERNEMQNEAERTVKNEFGLDAGLQLSGSYGPTVSFSSSLSMGFSTSSEETERRASSFSREVTEKTAERTRERLREETRRRTLEQVEELNRHKVDNTAAPNGHVRGIYRWLNKVYDAQVFNYGQRMMFEFVVPEPAAYFLWAIVENPPNETVLVKPTFPTSPDGSRPLQASDLTSENLHAYLTLYQVTDAPPHPASSLVVSHFDGLDDTGQSKTLGRGTKIGIPAGYETSTALLSAASAGMALDSFFVFIGGKSHVPLYDGLQRVITFNRKFAGEISVSIYGGSTSAYSLGIDLFCTLSDAGLAKWQQQAFEAILRSYLTQQAEYEEKLAAQQIQKGIQILGRNPLENRRIERDELKKLTISMLTDDSDPSLNAFFPGGTDAEPEIDVEAACAAGSRIRFFENAFEWRNMTYVLYPYFWGRKARWISALHLTDPDPDFAAFLKAGAARVQVPVRPGFESAIAYYCQTGKIWNGENPPLIDDDLYVPIVEEITENLGKLDGGVPYPEGSEPWEVRVPTSLVLVQNLEEIPGIRDTLTNQDANILPPGQ